MMLETGIAMGLVMLLTAWAIGRYRQRKLTRRLRRGHWAERRAERVLTRNGYRILRTQPWRTVCFQVGSQVYSAPVRSDYLVGKGRARYVVEVKSGARAPDPRNLTTRRQLREYCTVFPHPVLLLDVEKGLLEPVHFSDQIPAQPPWSVLRLAVCLTLLGLVALLWG